MRSKEWGDMREEIADKVAVAHICFVSHQTCIAIVTHTTRDACLRPFQLTTRSNNRSTT